MEKVTKFDDTEIQKKKFTNIKNIFQYKIDINKIVVSNKVSFGKEGLNILLATKLLKK